MSTVRGGCSRTVHDWLDSHNRTHHDARWPRPLWPRPWSGPWRDLAPYCFHHGARWTWAALHHSAARKGAAVARLIEGLVSKDCLITEDAR